METTTPATQRLHELDASAIAGMYEAAAEVVVCTQELANQGLNPVTAVLDGAAMVEEWAHYPSSSDVVDPSTGAQYYYHAHAAEERAPGEHGHFHTFLRPADPQAPEKGSSAAFTHLIGISMDRYGRPVRLFTTNRWVTGEDWGEADDVIPLLDRFCVGIVPPNQVLNRWLSALIRLFRPNIVDLVRARDRALAHWRQRVGGDVHEDRTLQVLSEAQIDLVGRIRAIEELAHQPPA